MTQLLYTNKPLNYFIHKLPKIMYSGNNLKSTDNQEYSKGVFKTPKHLALKNKYIQFNHDNLINFMVFDVDNNATEILNNLAYKPNIVIFNTQPNIAAKYTDKAHFIYFLKNPISRSVNALSKPFKFYKAVYGGIAIRLGADPHFNQNVMKNPLFKEAYKYLEIHNNTYTLTELADYFDTYDVYKSLRKKGNKLTGEGRNNTVFLRLSRSSRDFINQHKNSVSEPQFINFVKAEAERFNQALDNPMEQNELKGIIKSVSYWCWHIYTPKTKQSNRGRDTLINTHLNETERKALAAIKTNQERTNKTIEKIKKAVDTLQAKDKKITQKAIAELTGLNKNTLLKYKDLLKK